MLKIKYLIFATFFVLQTYIMNYQLREQQRELAFLACL